MDEQKYINIIALIVGVVSFGFMIFKSENEALQIGFAITIMVAAMVFFIYRNYNLNKENLNEIKNMKQIVTKFDEKLDIYNRLIKLENKVFKK